jgi:hypothetical protein
MASLWVAPKEIQKLINEIKDEHHDRLGSASVWALCADSKPIRNNQLVVTMTKKCSKTEKLSTGHDFKIIVLMEAWANLPDAARRLAVDEALSRCGVRYVPQTIEINGKKEVVKDDLGRTIFTDEIDVDKEGEPKWKINPPDAALYFPLLQRHGKYSEEAENTARAMAGKPIKGLTAADPKDLVDIDQV